MLVRHRDPTQHRAHDAEVALIRSNKVQTIQRCLAVPELIRTTINGSGCVFSELLDGQRREGVLKNRFAWF